MQSLTSLPTEILHKIIRFAEPESLKTLRQYDGYRVYNYGIWEGPREKTFRRFLRLFSRLKELPRLRSIVLGFYPESPGGVDGVLDVPYTLGIRSAAIKEFLSAITTLPQVPQELAFRELLNVNESNQDEVEQIEKVLQNLRSLRLNITNPHNWGDPETTLHVRTYFSTLTTIS
ncbi:unnamed protein product [Aspergillus oryzae var. brunneus]|uniref:Unnamed protein product n=1 Tax=Aspergillus oryzae var. brunneus TaxID=332754 RepID=A0ABQ6L896_ASPOZ|nr:unnamed protein product [Aspergillus oryzae]GMG54250.1 unnamed protein product [Aspergillus oryzae var. brunneus]